MVKSRAPRVACGLPPFSNTSEHIRMTLQTVNDCMGKYFVLVTVRWEEVKRSGEAEWSENIGEKETGQPSDRSSYILQKRKP